MDKNNEKDGLKLDEVVSSIVSTFKFHGVEISDVKLLPRGTPYFRVTVSKSKMTNTLEYTLDFVYWTLWTLLYGKYEESKGKELKINLDYTEVG